MSCETSRKLLETAKESLEEYTEYIEIDDTAPEFIILYVYPKAKIIDKIYEEKGK